MRILSLAEYAPAVSRSPWPMPRTRPGPRSPPARRRGKSLREVVAAVKLLAVIRILSLSSKAEGPPTDASYRSAGMDCSRWSRIFVTNLMIGQVSGTELFG